MTKNNTIKKIILIFLLALLIASGVYLYFLNTLKDEKDIYKQRFETVTQHIEENQLVIELYIEKFDKDTCEIKYNNLAIKDVLKVPCTKIVKNEFNSSGIYKIDITFKKYNLFPGKGYTIDEMQIISNNQTISSPVYSEYFNGVKHMLSQYSIQENVGCITGGVTRDKIIWGCNDSKDLTEEYLQLTYLTYQVAKKYDDKELYEYVNREIEYINNNYSKEDLRVEYKPNAYLLKLVEIGLDESFTEGYDAFDADSLQFMDFAEIKLNKDFTNLSLESESFSIEYRDIVQYSNNSKLFDEIGMDKGYSKSHQNMMIETYNESDLLLNGLCTIAYTTENEEIYKFLKPKIEEVIKNEIDTAITRNFVELNNCFLASQLFNSPIESLEDTVKELIRHTTVTNESGAFIVSSVSLEDSELKLMSYQLRDNLIYLLYWTEK